MHINKTLPLCIDVAFCLILLPSIIVLFPIERWFVDNALYVCLLMGWLYAVYFINRYITMKWLLESRKRILGALLVLLVTFIITYLISQYRLEPSQEHVRFVRQMHGGGNPQMALIKRIHQQALWLLYIVVLIFSMAVGLLTELYRQIMARQEVEYEKSKAQLSLYKAQINPHFLFNTLNTLYGLILTKSEKLEEVFMQFTNLMRYMYSDVSKDKIPLQTEIEYIRQYIDLQRYRMTDLTHINFKYPADKQTGQLQITPMLLIPFVENALKYGSSTREMSDININITLSDKKLIFTTENKIFPQRRDENKPKGIGITNCRKRLNLLYPDRHELNIVETEGLFVVKLIIN